MTSRPADDARTRALVGLSWGVFPVVAAFGCGTTFVPSDADAGDAGSGGFQTGSGGQATDIAASGGTGGNPSDGTNSGGQMATDAPEVVGGTTGTGGSLGPGGAGGTGSEDGFDCNPDHIICLTLVAPEPCPTGEAYSVASNCYGPCVPIGQCGCESATDCPDPNDTDEYTCHTATDRCGPRL